MKDRDYAIYRKTSNKVVCPTKNWIRRCSQIDFKKKECQKKRKTRLNKAVHSLKLS